MWAQIIRAKLKVADDPRYLEVLELLHGAEQPGSGLIRSITMKEQQDPTSIHMLVMFESEEAARARESDERRTKHLDEARKIMGEIFDGPPTFIDLGVIEDLSF